MLKMSLNKKLCWVWWFLNKFWQLFYKPRDLPALTNRFCSEAFPLNKNEHKFKTVLVNAKNVC